MSANPTRFIIFPIGREAEAEAYLALCEALNPDAGPGVSWDAPDKTDAEGRRVVSKLGAPWRYGAAPFTETPELAAARINGIEADAWTRPPAAE